MFEFFTIFFTQNVKHTYLDVQINEQESQEEVHQVYFFEFYGSSAKGSQKKYKANPPQGATLWRLKTRH